MTIKVIKGSIIADHLVDNTIEEYDPLSFDFLDKHVLTIEKVEGNDLWMMYFDGDENVYGNRARVVQISLDDRK